MSRRIVALISLITLVPPLHAAAPGLDAMLELVDQHYYRKLTADEKEELRRAAVSGLVDGLEELQRKKLGQPTHPPSHHAGAPSFPSAELKVNQLLTPGEAKLMRHEVSGTFGGIGIMIQRKEADATSNATTSTYVVKDFVEKSAARDAGVQKDDVILAVDDRPIAGVDMPEVVNMLRGPDGQPVKLKVQRAKDVKEISVTRRKIEWDPVDSSVLGDGVGYLKIGSFNEHTNASVERRLGELQGKGITSLVIDVRSCPGGLMDVAVKTADHFLPAGAVIARTERADGNDKQELKDAAAPLCTLPLVVLVDGETASSAELLALALRDHHRAILMGLPTRGKGTAEKLVELPDGYLLRLTSMVFFGPSGQTPATGGLAPDVVLGPARRDLEDGETADDPWVQSARRVLAFGSKK